MGVPVAQVVVKVVLAQRAVPNALPRNSNPAPASAATETPLRSAYGQPLTQQLSVIMKSLNPIFVTLLTTGLSVSVLHAAQSYTIVATGQTKCYDNRGEIAPPKPGEPFCGQDAQFHNHPASYTLSTDGLTVRDNVTALTWQRSPDTDGDGTLTRRDKLTLAKAPLPFS